MSLFGLEIHSDERPDWPVVRILVDGADPFEGVAPNWLGFDPDDILGPGSPLLPGAGRRRVAVYRCSCGEAGCGVIAPAIDLSDDGRFVRWQDFRNYVGVFFGPLATGADPELIPSRRWDVPDLRFDSEQYLATVAHAAEDRSWETPRRRTSRLLYEHLERLDLVLPPNLPLRRVTPAWEGDGVVAWFEREDADGVLSQHHLQLSSRHEDPEHAARELADAILSTPPSDWLGTFGPRA